MRTQCSALWLVLSLLTGLSEATTYYVANGRIHNPDGTAEHPFEDLQFAVDKAQNGDTIIVAPGRYLSYDPWKYDELRFNGKSIRLLSSAPTDLDVADQTILCGVVIFQGDEDPNCLLQGFKIQNHDCGGILGNKTLARISHCIISGNGPCGATVVKDVWGRISNCLIVDNTTFHDCGLSPVVAGCHELVNCTIANNLSNVQITDWGLPWGGYITMRNCILYGNGGGLTYHTDLAKMPNGSQPWYNQIDYCMIENTTGMIPYKWSHHDTFMQDTDPCFVQPGRWEKHRDIWSGPTEKLIDVLIEGDYHLRSQGWRWSPGLNHGSHWYYDMSTSPAIDAGDPMASLADEPERVPEDPQGQWGFNHAIDLGAYGGTAQASLGPTQDSPAPGVGAVDLHDYWPLAGYSANRWVMYDPQGIYRGYIVSNPDGVANAIVPVWGLGCLTDKIPDWVLSVYCFYFDQTFYMITDEALLGRLPETPQQFQAKYPQYFVVGATIDVPYDPFVKGVVQYHSVLVTRGTLAEVLTGTSLKRTQFLPGQWPDVIALKEKKTDDTTGDPIAIFARGFGPLMIAGRPAVEATVREEYYTWDTPLASSFPRQ